METVDGRRRFGLSGAVVWRHFGLGRAIARNRGAATKEGIGGREDGHGEEGECHRARASLERHLGEGSGNQYARCECETGG